MPGSRPRTRPRGVEISLARLQGFSEEPFRAFPDWPRRPAAEALSRGALVGTPSVRGIFVLNAFDFVCEHYSPAAHAAVIEALPARRTALTAAREASWTPLDDLVAYMEKAKALLAPG